MTTSREIMTALIKEKKCPERMGLYEHYWGDTIGEWETQGYPQKTSPADYFHYDMEEIGGCWFDTSPYPGTHHKVHEDEDTEVSINGWGATARWWKKKSGTPEHLAFELINRDVWNAKYREPLLTLNTKRFDLPELKKNYARFKAGTQFFAYNNVTIFEIMRASMGDVIMLESMYTDPEWIVDFCDVVTNSLIASFDYLYREVGLPDGMFIYEDMGYTQAPFISPDLQRELIMPFHKRLGNFFHDNNVPFIMHSCGKIQSYLPAIYEAGVDCLQVLEAKAGQHVADFAATVNNKMAFMGNLNIKAFETNDKAQIDAEILPKLDLVRKNKIPFIFHSDHSIPRTVTFETYKYVMELYRKNCAY